MRYLLFLLWVPALLVLYLSVHQEILSEHRSDAREKPHIPTHTHRPHGLG